MNREKAVTILFRDTPTTRIVGEFETFEFFEFWVDCNGTSATYRIYKDSEKVW